MNTLASVTFVPIQDDYAAVYANALTRSTKDNRLRAALMLSIASFGATFTTLMIAGAVSLQSAFAAVVCSIIFMWVFAIQTWTSPERRARLQYSPEKNPLFFIPRTLQLEDLGIRLSSDNSELWYGWARVQQVTITDEHLIITCGTTTLFVPSRAFQSREGFIAFARIAQDRYTPPPDTAKPQGFEVVMHSNTNGE